MLTGKSINFLRRLCNEEEWATSTPLETPRLSDHVALKKWVESASYATNARLVKVLLDKYQFKKHANSIRKYLLLGQGDFHHVLMELLSEELNENATKIYKHNLVSILESAIRASNAQYDENDCLGRLDVKLLEASSGDFGWDVFTLDYRVDSPISTIFDARVMEDYLRLFKFLWRIKRVDFKLKMYEQSKTALQLLSLPDIRVHLHKCHLLRHEILHFVTNLINYLMVEVVDAAWNEFLEAL